ncbi:MAG: SDR family NAD(P)-dependent oxidoreductase [Alphaproteobacteria bacterium]|nr:SDR family NAD(P)-dependent oxidoreductase [Alphaproteobacteria bacterium]
MDLDLSGKVAVVTGGSKGIGYAAAHRLASEGAQVVIAARRVSALAEAAAVIADETGHTPETMVVDVAQAADLDRFVTWLKDRFGRVDILINNAGTGTYKPFLEVTDDELEYGMAINFFAQFRLSQRVVPMMIAQGGGSIVNVAGRTAYQTALPPGSTCTGPAKAAELRFTADLADELRPHNIRVNCVVPGVVVTEERFEKWEREAAGNAYDPAAARTRRDKIVKEDGPWGDAWQVADTILYLASDRASYVNGASLLVDGANKKSYTRLLRERE